MNTCGPYGSSVPLIKKSDLVTGPVVHRVGRGIALLFYDRGTRRGEWSAARPGCTLPPGNTRYLFYRRLGGPVWMGGKSRPRRDSISDRAARSSVAIPTELLGPLFSSITMSLM